jgi:hypothetical protein
MEMENRLAKLSTRIALERRKGFIKNWSDEIKKEAIFLFSIFGVTKTINATKLSGQTLYLWKKEFKEKKSQFYTECDNKTIEVTRIVASSQTNESNFKEQIVIASIIKNEIELKIYCKETATKIVERFFT